MVKNKRNKVNNQPMLRNSLSLLIKEENYCKMICIPITFNIPLKPLFRIRNSKRILKNSGF